MRAGLNLSVRSALQDGFLDLEAGETMSTHSSGIPMTEIEELLDEACRVPSYLARRIPEWPNTSRATLFPRESSNSKLRYRALASSNTWTPKVHQLSMDLAETVRRLGSSTNISNKFKLPTESLENWAPNRIGINYMHGKPWDPAAIPAHTDVKEEAGVVITLGLLGKDAGRLSMIFGHDVCTALGLEQTEHGSETTETRIGITIAQLHPKSQAS